MKRYIYPLILVVLTALIAVLNYSGGTYLTGWDTLHPELDFGLNFGRLVQGVWRAEQGLGALAGHSHMADLPRVAILWLISLVSPLSFVRYSYVFLCLIASPLGVYFLIQKLLSAFAIAPNPIRGSAPTTSTLNPSRRASLHSRPESGSTTQLEIAFCGALFYLLNLGTVQQFYAPFEMFTTQWAVLPWIVLYSLKYLEQKSSRNTLLIFALVTLFSAPMAYAAQLWYAFFGVYALFLFGYILANRYSWKKGLMLIGLTIAVNSFWLLPNLYFVATGSSVPRESKQNRIFSQEYSLRNRQNGYIADVALLKGFYLDWPLYNSDTNDFETLMPVWRDHMEKPWVQAIGYTMAASAAAGVLFALYRRSRTYLPFLPFVIVPAILLLNRTWPFNLLFDYFLTFGLLEEALRFVFSKLSIVLLFGYTIFFSYFLLVVIEKVGRYLKIFLVIVVASSLLAYMSPIFKGQLISPSFTVEIPQDYFEFWKFMKTRPDGRVLSVPLHSFSGWVYHNWGYQGSGFLWFGLKQPLMDRDSDRWNSANEEAYREFHYAFYTGTPDDVERTLSKYNIRYLVWDTSITAPTLKNTAQILYTRQNKEILAKYKKLASFGSIHVFEVPEKKKNTNSVIHNVLPAYQWGYADQAYKMFGTYITSENFAGLTFPFRTIQSQTDRLDTSLINVDTQNDLYRITSPVKLNGTMKVPALGDSLQSIVAGVQLEKTTIAGTYKLVFIPLVPQGLLQSAEHIVRQTDTNTFAATINGTKLTSPLTELLDRNRPIYLGEVSLYLHEQNYINGTSVKIEFNSVKSTEATQNLYLRFGAQPITFTASELAKRVRNTNHMSINQGHSDPRLYFEVTEGQAGTYIGLENLAHDTGYIFVVRSRNLEGLPLRVCLADLYSHLCTLYDELSPSQEFTDDYFLIPPSAQGIGYGLSLDNIAFAGMSSRNEVKQVIAIPIPSQFLSALYAQPKNYKALKSDSIYTINTSFHDGWILFDTQNPLSFFYGGPEHILVNNWQNGWVVEPNTSKHYMSVFLPQWLQYAGFTLAGGAIALAFFRLKRAR